jgi:hypothetical protein
MVRLRFDSQKEVVKTYTLMLIFTWRIFQLDTMTKNIQLQVDNVTMDIQLQLDNTPKNI